MSSAEHRVLIVEDDGEVRDALAQFFSARGFEVTLAQSGTDAIEMLEDQGPPCAVLVDLLMPGIVGQEVLEYLRAEQRFGNIPVAIISGSPRLAPPGYPVFPKPIDASALITFVRTRCAQPHPPPAT